jgi:hypothetical protein
MPSYYESLSMVVLEAWALGRPVLVNGQCDVLKGQCIRSNAGLYYDDPREFVATLDALERNRWLVGVLGRNGRQFFRAHYDWPVIERKYLDVLAQLAGVSAVRRMEPRPGWLARRRRTLPPAETVMRTLPAGPVLDETDHPPAPRPLSAAPVEPPSPRAATRHPRAGRRS